MYVLRHATTSSPATTHKQQKKKQMNSQMKEKGQWRRRQPTKVPHSPLSLSLSFVIAEAWDEEKKGNVNKYNPFVNLSSPSSSLLVFLLFSSFHYFPLAVLNVPPRACQMQSNSHRDWTAFSCCCQCRVSICGLWTEPCKLFISQMRTHDDDDDGGTALTHTTVSTPLNTL